ncbi:MAG: hypothetical protein KKE62_01975 [Proteobacteria bacterium]|nr:hypothetical protein [Pseudomonadota bacterium]MBU1387093.1 hypothetical protein [Pseudomonadota bacterium]MBU1541590.1 hypothetical protein [Pseudomonadota bacterium]MBU2430347.1 hypothetical protein [Pseudomonadota bacterium]MBU2482547.1 hypothetical protein [Pseudomonadota bacterium]
MVKLKKGQEAFVVVDGPDAGRTYRQDTTYPQAPKGYETRFEQIKPKPVPQPETDRKRSK